MGTKEGARGRAVNVGIGALVAACLRGIETARHCVAARRPVVVRLVIVRREDQDMPGETPHNAPAQDRPAIREDRQPATSRGALARLRAHLTRASAMAFAVASPAAAFALEAGAQPGSIRFNSTDIMLLAIFGGAMSFAILSATWLIRERARITGENAMLKARIGDMRASHERLEALVNSGDQRIVVWNGADDKPAILGKLSKSSGAPADRAAFLAFGRWLTPDSAISFEGALKRLRLHAEAFDLPLTTRTGVIEAQGRTSGSHAFVRFIELSGERSALAQLEAEHARLMATFDSIQLLFEKLPVPVWLRDAGGELFWVNKAYSQAVDCADGEQAVLRRAQLLDSSERNEIARKQRDEGYFAGALPAIMSGDRRQLDITEVKTQAGYAGIAIDRNEVESVRATLKQTIATHAHTLDHLATAVAMFDKDRRLQFYNSSFQKLFGLAPGFLESQPDNAQVLDAIRAERKLPEVPDWRKWREGQLEIYKALEAREDWWHMPDGRTLRVVVNPHNQGGATWVFENVTEQLELQTNYNSLMRIQGETLDNLSEAVAVFGSDGKLKLCNPAFEQIWSLQKGELESGAHISQLSETLRDRLANADTWQAIAQSITGFEVMRGDLSGRLDMADGKVVDYALVRLPEGQTMLAVVDMTAAVNVERALKERNEALEQADKLKNRFLQHVSYELRAPLTSIAGFSELLHMPEIGKLNEKQFEYIGHITTSAEVLKNIIDDILDLATIDAGAMTLDFEPLDLGIVVDACREELAEAMAARGLRLKVAGVENVSPLMGDKRRIRQILGNLLSNAVSFSPDGGTVTISAQLSGETLEVAVIDEGPGVPEEMRGSIFERFEGRSSGERRRGAGLGLSVVKSFVELHGGSVHVENAQGRGARFVLRLPAMPHAGRAAA
jgi:signal transduction histidine kinase